MGNLFFRPNTLEKAGDKVQGHTHNFDHVTIIWSGAVHVIGRKGGQVVSARDFGYGEFCLIKADVEHEITALVDNTLFVCVYSHRDPQGRVTQEYTGWGPAYV